MEILGVRLDGGMCHILDEQTLAVALDVFEERGRDACIEFVGKFLDGVHTEVSPRPLEHPEVGAKLVPTTMRGKLF